MLRLLHLADVHLGARHPDLGPAGAIQRERQHAAFAAALELAITESVDLLLIAGDLFDSNVQPHRTVSRVAADLRRAIDAGSRVVILPGRHDVYDSGSVYRTYDLPGLAGLPRGSDGLTILTPDRPSITYRSLGATILGHVAVGRDAPGVMPGPLGEGIRWRIGMAHGSLRTADGWLGDGEAAIDEGDIAGTGFDYLALGHAHGYWHGRSGATVWAYPGAPEPVDVTLDGAGRVILVGLHDVEGPERVRMATRVTGRTRYLRLDVDAAEVDGALDLVGRIASHADPDLVCDARITGQRPDTLLVDEAELSRRMGGSFLHFRFRDLSVPPLAPEPLPPRDTVAGAFIHDLHARIAAAESEGKHAEAVELREILRVGRTVIAGGRVGLPPALASPPAGSASSTSGSVSPASSDTGA
jgi:DNA repair exonuclease SbcCD nuclease subunit